MYHIDPLANATLLWSKFGKFAGRCHTATVPPLGGLRAENVRAELKRLYDRKSIGDTIDDMDDMDIALAGLGIFSPIRLDGQNANQLTVAGLLEDIVSPTSLHKDGVRGDLAYSLFGADGQPKPEWEFFLTAGYGLGRSGIRFYQDMVADKKRNRYVVVIAGTRKHTILLPALNAEFFNVWITDAASARHVLMKSRG